jgi:DNA (cytosine-5)-methyltransferase 1
MAGFEIAGAYDKDEVLTSSYSRNFPKSRLFLRDVAALTGEQILADVGGSVEGVFGGPPCQGFSSIGKRNPADPRRTLLKDFFRVTAELKPSFFVMENVKGLAYADARPVLEAALDLVRSEYDVTSPVVLDAADYGAATRRSRMFVIGIRKDIGSPFDPSFVERRKRRPATVKAAIADLARCRRVADDPTLPGFDRWQIRQPGLPSDYAWALRAEGNMFTGHQQTAHSKQVVERFAKVKPGAMDKVGRHPRLKWTGLCPTLRAGTGSDLGSFQSVRPIHPDEDRVITVREAARLQGFPDDHLFHPTIWHSFRMIGNSVSPIMAEAIFAAVRDHLDLGRAGRGRAETGPTRASDEKQVSA